MAKTFDNVEVYVRVSSDGYEGQSLRFATVNEDQALNTFSTEGEIYAPDWNGEELQVFVGGVHVTTWYRRDKKWTSSAYRPNPVEYGTIQVQENGNA